VVRALNVPNVRIAPLAHRVPAALLTPRPARRP
jgi:hypothetical protein